MADSFKKSLRDAGLLLLEENKISEQSEPQVETTMQEITPMNRSASKQQPLLSSDDNAFASFAIDGLGSSTQTDRTNSLLGGVVDIHKRTMSLTESHAKNASMSNASSLMAGRIS